MRMDQGESVGNLCGRLESSNQYNQQEFRETNMNNIIYPNDNDININNNNKNLIDLNTLNSNNIIDSSNLNYNNKDSIRQNPNGKRVDKIVIKLPELNMLINNNFDNIQCGEINSAKIISSNRAEKPALQSKPSDEGINYKANFEILNNNSQHMSIVSLQKEEMSFNKSECIENNLLKSEKNDNNNIELLNKKHSDILQNKYSLDNDNKADMKNSIIGKKIFKQALSYHEISKKEENSLNNYNLLKINNSVHEELKLNSSNNNNRSVENRNKSIF